MPRLSAISLALLLAPFASAQRIVAVGDVHGDFEQFAAVLRSAGLIDARHRWTGGDAHFVQTGDIPDRGPDTRRILDLMMDLEKQAKRAGGAVHGLIGNHEAMNVYGDLRYVSPGEYASFRTGDSQRTAGELWKAEVERLVAQGKPVTPEYRKKWEEEHPPGWYEHRMAFSPGGRYHKWIGGNDAVVKIGDSLFLHGGIGPKYAAMDLKTLNERIRAELKDLAKVAGGIAADEAGPLWFRGLAASPEAELADHVDAVLQRHGVKRIVIGHTPTEGAVLPRFGGKVVLIDVGLSSPYGKRLACFAIEDGKPVAIHRGTKLPLPASGTDLLEYLKRAAALDPQPSPLAALIAKLQP